MNPHPLSQSQLSPPKARKAPKRRKRSGITLMVQSYFGIILDYPRIKAGSREGFGKATSS